jgi:hypothetical protein
MPFRRIRAQPVATRDCTLAVEPDHVRHPFQNDKRFLFRRRAMAVRSYIRFAQKNIQKPVRIIGG